MEHCPTCGGRYRGGDTCGRCQTDLSQILRIERAASRLRARAIAALHAGQPRAADTHARAACQAHRCTESLQMAALTSLACRDFRAAAALWAELKRESQSVK